MNTTMKIMASAALLVAANTYAADAVSPPKAEPAMQKVLDALASLGGKPIETLTPEEARKQPTPADAVKKVLEGMGKSTAPDSSVTVKQLSATGPLGPIPLFVYSPPGKGPFPVVLYYHGGGFVIADTKTYDASPRALAKAANAIIVSVDYHRAPENKFPAAPNDALSAYKWVLAHAQEFNGDPKRVAVSGESAGANLATVVSQMARDEKIQLPLHQLLVYPVVNDDMATPSYERNANAKPLNKAMMQWFFKHYTAKPDDAKNPHALPIKAASLAGLPPATIIAAEIDPLLTEGKQYGDALKKAGVAVSYKEYSGVTHEFFGMDAVVPKAKEAQGFAADNLKKAFEKK